MAQPVIERKQRTHDAVRSPEIEEGGEFVRVHATWGKVQPLHIAPGVDPVDELDVIAQLAAGGPVIDTRSAEAVAKGSIPGAEALHYEGIEDHLDRFSADHPTILYCNGPQCLATPRAIERLLAAGCDPAALLYYRGGIQDWVCLGYPLAT